MNRIAMGVLMGAAVVVGLFGCGEASRTGDYPPSPGPPSNFSEGLGKVRLSILFPRVAADRLHPTTRVIPEGTRSVLITVTGEDISADKPFRKGYDRPGPTQPQRVDAELILPLGNKTIKAEAKDVSASDAERFGAGNTLASASQTITLKDENFFDPVTVVLDLQPPAAAPLFAPDITWELKDSGTVIGTDAGREDFSQLVTWTAPGDDLVIRTRITASLHAPEVESGKPFSVTFTLKREVEISGAVETLKSRSQVHLVIPNRQGPPVDSWMAPSNPDTIWEKLDFRPSGSVYQIDQTASTAFAGYGTDPLKTFIPHGSDSFGAYSGNWTLGTWQPGLTQHTLNSQVWLYAVVFFHGTTPSGYPFNRSYSLQAGAIYKPKPAGP